MDNITIELTPYQLMILLTVMQNVAALHLLTIPCEFDKLCEVLSKAVK
jgi:hypothetical protein